MTKVSELVSQNVGSAITNFQTWGGILTSVKNPTFGAKGDYNTTTGIGTDDAIAIQAAINAVSTSGGGVVLLPFGKYYVGTTITVPANVTLCGFSVESNVNNSTVSIIGSLTLSPIVILDGLAASTSASLKNLAVTRVAGAIPVGVVGVRVKSTDYPVIEDVNISRHAIGLDIVGNVGCVCNRVIVYSSTDTHCQVAGIQVSFTDCSFGRNGGENGIAATNVIRITGNADTISFTRCQLNPTLGGVTNGINFFNYTATNGIIKFVNCHIENMTNIITSNAGTALIARLFLNGNTISAGSSNNFVSLNAATSAGEWILNGNNITGVFTLNKGYALTISDNRFSGAVTLALDSANVTGNTFNTGVTLNGVWNNLVFSFNIFDGVAQKLIDNSTGRKSIVGNVSTTGYSNQSILPDDYLTIGGGISYAVKRFTGTLDGTGAALFAHGIASGQQAGLMILAYFKGTSAEMKPMTVASMDGTGLSITGGTASQPYRVTVLYSNTLHAW